ncbi:MAG: Bax inhibitor-1/YccA family membrane protein [Acholeplasmataceae bacterium]|jgi:uncharacterized YccA/Bax inhibitor family protein
MNRSSNPVFRSLEKQQVITADAATSSGVASKTIILLLVTFASAALSVIFGLQLTKSGEGIQVQIDPWLYALLSIAFVTSFISVLVATFFPRVAMPFSILYSLGEGALLGTLTAIINAVIPGVAITALLGVGSIFLVMLFLYTSRTFRVTNKFRRAMIAGMIAILLTSLFSGILSMIAPAIFARQYLAVAIIVSIVLIIFGAFMLMLDFDYADSIVQAGFPKNYEWVAALGFMVTLVWIYVQILRLLILIAARRE